MWELHTYDVTSGQALECLGEIKAIRNGVYTYDLTSGDKEQLYQELSHTIKIKGLAYFANENYIKLILRDSISDSELIGELMISYNSIPVYALEGIEKNHLVTNGSLIRFDREFSILKLDSGKVVKGESPLPVKMNYKVIVCYGDGSMDIKEFAAYNDTEAIVTMPSVFQLPTLTKSVLSITIGKVEANG